MYADSTKSNEQKPDLGMFYATQPGNQFHSSQSPDGVWNGGYIQSLSSYIIPHTERLCLCLLNEYNALGWSQTDTKNGSKTGFGCFKNRDHFREDLYWRCDKCRNESRIAVQAAVHVVTDPLEERRGVWVGVQLLPQLRLHTEQRKQETQTAVVQDLHHAVLAVVQLCCTPAHQSARSPQTRCTQQLRVNECVGFNVPLDT